MGERHSIPKGLRWQVLARDRFSCRYCGRKPPDVVLEIDHMQPVDDGGKNYEGNLVTSCEDCNNGKRAKLLPEPLDPPVVRKDQREALEETAAILHEYPAICGGLYGYVKAQMTDLLVRGVPQRAVLMLMMFTAIDLAATLFRKTEGEVERREFMKLCAAAFEDNPPKDDAAT